MAGATRWNSQPRFGLTDKKMLRLIRVQSSSDLGRQISYVYSVLPRFLKRAFLFGRNVSGSVSDTEKEPRLRPQRAQKGRHKSYISANHSRVRPKAW